MGRIGHLSIPGVRFVLLAIVAWSRYLRAIRDREEGWIVFFDRYVYDATDPSSDRSTSTQWFERRLATRLCPKPDFVFVLDAPGSVMAERIGGSATALEESRWFFRQLKNRFPDIVFLDASRDALAVRDDVVNRFWQTISERWEGRAW